MLAIAPAVIVLAARRRLRGAARQPGGASVIALAVGLFRPTSRRVFSVFRPVARRLLEVRA